MIENKVGWKFNNTYSKLPKNLLSKIQPLPVKAPKVIIFNQNLSKELNLDFSQVDKKELALIFSGNQLPAGSESISQAYAGHQFGYFTILGDGRAHVIGEHIAKDKKRYDIQFKGSGNADGRAALGPMLREYLISESMHKLGVPTTRSLAVVETGEKIIREEILEGAILTRVASSHIRVGTFQYALISKEKKNLKTLLDYTINRHYPEIIGSNNPALELLKTVSQKQIELITNWMRIGFVHGVMNTDNMTISGETIDYGPCAFMDNYDPNTVFSSIDVQGRYAFFNQPLIAIWNLERFAETLISLIDDNQENAINKASEVIKYFSDRYQDVWLEMMRKKLGIIGKDENDKELIIDLLKWMHEYRVDYTNTFCHLMDKLTYKNKIYENEKFIIWKKKWEKRRELNNNSFANSLKIMSNNNPLIIPRNNFVEEALNFATKNNDLSKIHDLLKIMKNPYNYSDNIINFQKPGNSEKKYTTYCGT